MARQSTKPAPPQRSRRREPQRARLFGPFFGLLVALFIAAAFFLGPRLMDAHAAFQWTLFYAARGAGPPKTARAADQARHAARWAVLALDRAAPWPVAAEAARLALNVGRDLAPRYPEAALSLYTDVHAALERARTSRVRGLGLADLTAEAQAAETTLRARLAEQRRQEQ